MPEISSSKYLINCGWDDSPHLSERKKAEMYAASEPHLREARSKGTPSLGIGAVYTVAESEFVIPPFKIPEYWVKGYGFDVGWNRTAVVWGAHDRDTDTLYLTSEHYRGQAEPSTHASAIRARGDWIPGFIDPAANGRQQHDGEQLLASYLALGLKVTAADNAVEAGIFDVGQRLQTGRLKVFSSLGAWLTEYRIYRRDKNGKIVKKVDHLMDATRYLVRPSSMERMIVKPVDPMLFKKNTPNLYR